VTTRLHEHTDKGNGTYTEHVAMSLTSGVSEEKCQCAAS